MRHPTTSLFLLCLIALLAAGCGGGGTPAVTGDGPVITSVEPASGGVAGGTPLVVRGTSLANPVAGEYQVLIGGQPAAEVKVVSDTQVECTTPPGTQGAADVEIVTVEGAGLVPGAFTYYPPPTVTSITPNEGTRDGGVAVTVTGTGFTANDPGDTLCTIELKELLNLVVVDDTTLTGITPTSWTETYKDVTVANRNGQGTLNGAFRYVGPVPLIYAVSPAEGPRSGGTLVTVTGEYYTSAGGELSVRFGNAEASLVTRIDDQTITCIAPLASAAGFVDVTVGNNNGESTLPNAFYYIPAPVLSSIIPNSGSIMGGEAVTIVGFGFTAAGAGANFVTIGGVLATSIVTVNDTTITCLTPPGPEGFASVVVTNGNGQGSLPNAYEYTFAYGWDPDYGGTITSGDDTYTSFSFGGLTFPFFGVNYTSGFFGSNGNISFGSGWSSLSAVVPTVPHIAFVQNDMNPNSGGSLHVKTDTGRVVMTMNGVPEYGMSNSSTIQVQIFEGGIFIVMWQQVQATGYIVSTGPGAGQSNYSVDWTAEPSFTSNQAPNEATPSDLVGNGLLFVPNASGGYDTTLFSL